MKPVAITTSYTLNSESMTLLQDNFVFILSTLSVSIFSVSGLIYGIIAIIAIIIINNLILSILG